MFIACHCLKIILGSTEHEASENGAKDIVELITRKEMALNNEGWQNWETKSGAKGKKGREKRLKNTRGSGSASGDDALTEESKDDEVKDLSAVLDKEDESRSLPPVNFLLLVAVLQCFVFTVEHTE